MSISIALLFSLLVCVRAICYYPDGTPTPDDVPCLLGNEPSWCCGFGYACLSNKICMATSKVTRITTTYVRGSCTDESWRSGNCPSFCVNPNPPWSDNTAGGEGMAICPNTTNTFYCVDYNEGAVNCAGLSNVAVQGTGSPSILTTIGFGPTSSPASSRVASSSRGSLTLTPINLSSSTSLTGTPTPSHTTQSHASATSSPPSSQSSSTPVGAIVGGTVGGVLGIALIVLLAVFLFKRSTKTHHAGDDIRHEDEGYSNTPGYHDSEYQKVQSNAMYEIPGGRNVYQSELEGTDVPELGSK